MPITAFKRHYRVQVLLTQLSKSSAGNGCRQETRRLCKPHAISITPAAMPLVVKRNTSLTIRHRLIPAITCSTTTRTLEKIRLQNFSPTVSSLPWGFFWAAWSTRLPAHSLESRYLCLAWCWYGRQLASRPPPSCHASCPATLVLDRQLCPCVR